MKSLGLIASGLIIAIGLFVYFKSERSEAPTPSGSYASEAGDSVESSLLIVFRSNLRDVKLRKISHVVAIYSNGKYKFRDRENGVTKSGESTKASFKKLKRRFRLIQFSADDNTPIYERTGPPGMEIVINMDDFSFQSIDIADKAFYRPARDAIIEFLLENGNAL